MKKILFLLPLALLLVVSCGKNVQKMNADSAADSAAVSEDSLADQGALVSEEADSVVRNAIANFLLRRSGAAVLAESAKKDLFESSWPEVQCSVDQTLDSPRSYKDLVVKRVGDGKYKYECVCPTHGDRFVDCYTIEAVAGADGVVSMVHVVLDNKAE